jgi:hypothetical protein
MSSFTPERRSRALAIAFGIFDLFAAGLVSLGVFAALPARYWLVDAGAVVVVLVQVSAGVGLLGRFAWGKAVARWASLVTLALGLALIAALSFSVSYLIGIYGPVGRGGAIIFTLVIALVFPYLVVLPAGQLVWLGPRRTIAS